MQTGKGRDIFWVNCCLHLVLKDRWDLHGQKIDMNTVHESRCTKAEAGVSTKAGVQRQRQG